LNKYQTFSDFYLFYLSEHSKRGTKIFHFIGTTGVFIFLFLFFYTGEYRFVLYAPLSGYGFAWISHMFIEKNRPATFSYPFYSLIGDFRMYFDILLRRIEI